MSSQDCTIWFTLLDYTTGEPFKGTGASKLSVAPSADVVDFQDAVYLKWDKPGFLKDIPSGALLVYKNKSSFNKRNVPNDPEGKSLDPTESIGVLGSKEDMLVVAVPLSNSFTESSDSSK
jgi:hypothetical protein